MQEIIQAQGGNPNIDSEDLKPGKFSFKLLAEKSSTVKGIDSSNITTIAKILGAPEQKGAGMYLEKKLGENVGKGELLCTFFSESTNNLDEAKQRLKDIEIFKL